MTRQLIVLSAGPGVTVQDLGRFGHIASGASPGGVADADALFEGAALLGQSTECAALEITGLGGRFEVTEPTRIALTGASAKADRDGLALSWSTSHLLAPGDRLSIGPPQGGNYAYLHVGGGIATPQFLGSRATHLVAGIGGPVEPGPLPLGADHGTETGLILDPSDRFGGGTLRIIASAQTVQFSADDVARLQSTAFTRDPRGNRMGARMQFDGAPFLPQGGLSIVSEMVVPGDIQIAGDGAPFVLLGECQTTGGYPRIGTVIPPDLPRVAQARPGDPLQFEMISRDAALGLHGTHQAHLKALAPRPRQRDPHDIADLLSYQLISGATSGEDT